MTDVQTDSRAQLSVATEGMKEVVERAHKTLQQGLPEDCYISVVYESRAQTSARCNLRKRSLDDELSEGLIFRVFDGLTMFEQATDKKDWKTIEHQLNQLMARVQSSTVPEGSGQKVVYQSPSWSERLKEKLDPAITSQIPGSPDPSTWVHFGAYWGEPYWNEKSEVLDYGKELLKKLSTQRDALSKDHPGSAAQMLTTIVSSEVVEFLFQDSSVRMSQTLTRDRVVLVAVKDGQRGVFIQGGLGGRETTKVRSQDFEEVFENLQSVLNAEPLKAGRYKLLMHPAISGVFAHEAFGHTQEGDTWARGRSRAKMLYEKQIPVGNQNSNILNNPAVFRNGTDGFAGWGSYFFDEEGWLSQKHYLVKEGCLQAPMTNLTSSLRLGVPRTANGKRESWTNGMYTRQTNTYFEEGDLSFSELLSKVDYGFLATQPYGGMEDPKGMGIQVGIQFLQEIRDGQFTGKTFKGPAGGAIQMTGYVPDYLNSITAKSKIDAFDENDGEEFQHPWNEAGGCGKYHKESVVAGCGGPYMLVENVLLG